MKPLTYEERSKYCCDICGNVPDEDGVIEHGKGCYTQGEDGGGTSYVEFDPPGEAIMDKPDRHDETAAKLLPPGIFGTEPGRAFFAEARRREVAAALREAAASAPAGPLRNLLEELPCGRDGGLPQKPGWYLWHRSDVSYLEVGVVQILKDSESHIAYLRGQMANGKDARQFYLYQNDSGEWLTLYHSAYPHVLPTCDPDGKPYVDGYEPFDWYWRNLGLSAPPVSAWRPISEAPKDGTPVYLLSAMHEFADPALGTVKHLPNSHIGYWEEDHEMWNSGSGWFEEGEVTHYMPIPLPAPPEPK